MNATLEAKIDALLTLIGSPHHEASQTLGFQPAPRYSYVYVGDEGCWYTLKEDKSREQIKEDSLVGTILGLQVKDVTTTRGTAKKCQIHIRADKRYILRSGLETHFVRSLVSCLLAATDEQLANPLRIVVRNGDDAKVVFASLYVPGQEAPIRGERIEGGNSAEASRSLMTAIQRLAERFKTLRASASCETEEFPGVEDGRY